MAAATAVIFGPLEREKSKHGVSSRGEFVVVNALEHGLDEKVGVRGLGDL